MARKRIKKRSRAKSPARVAAEEAERAKLAAYSNPNMVLSFAQWCLLCNISRNLGRTLLREGKGPIITTFGLRRIGVTLGNHQRWLETRNRVRGA
jgi:hypothetical protein